MTTLPSPNGSNGRDRSGRFASGNSGGPGNPHARQVAQLRSTMLRAVTAKDLRAITKALVEKAKAGDVMAAREVLDRCFGKPRQGIDLEAEARVEAVAPGSFKSFDQMSDIEIAEVIIEGGMADKLPPILRAKIERLHPGRLHELETQAE